MYITINEREENGARVYAASLPYRDIEAEAKDPEEAKHNLLMYYCGLARSGAFNPEHPRSSGESPIQHAMTVLCERLTKLVKERDQQAVLSDEAGKLSPDAAAVFALGNEKIAGIATAIAALGRIKST